MQLSRLAAKQKRFKDMLNYTRSGMSNLSVAQEFQETLGRYQRLLTKSWKAQAISAEDEVEIASVERELNRLLAEARYFKYQPSSGQPA